MKFSSVLAFATTAFAAPALFARDQTAAGTVNDAITTLQNAVGQNTAAINKAAAQIKGSTDASLVAQVQSSISANYKAIFQALQDATNTITGTTTGAAGGIASSLQGLTQQDIDTLTNGLKNAADVAAQIQSSVSVTMTDLTPAAQQAVQGELDSVKNAIEPFATPLAQFGDAVSKASASANVNADALVAAQSDFTNTVQSLVKSLGLPMLQLPSAGSLPAPPSVPGVGM